MKLLHQRISEKTIGILEFALIIVTAIIPLFLNHPYRINLFLAWEGAFRMYNGEIPYRDFGSPVGYGFWILPALFFRIFGPYVYTLLIVQAFINVVSGVTFRGVLKLFGVTGPVRLVSLMVYCLSYSMFNFWPWYNHLVFVFELIGLHLLCTQLLKAGAERKLWPLIVSAFLIALSFLTKQDTGALAVFIAIILLGFDLFLERNIRSTAVFLIAYTVSMAVLILPFIQYDFLYWFNMGQPPHNARVDKFDIINEFLGASSAIKFYLLFIVLILIYHLRDIRSREDLEIEKRFSLFGLLVLCILGQAAIIQVTSYTPIDGNIYFHSFCFAFIVFHFSRHIDMSKAVNLVLMCFLVCLWWSGVFWTRFLRERVEKILVTDKSSRENVISKRTYLLSGDTTASSNRSKWIVPGISSFKRIRIPEATSKGIEQLMEMPVTKKPDLKMLNMSELTPLAYDMGYALEKNSFYPLWFHKGVSFFDREVDMFCDRINRKEYDIILFEDIPNVNQFYPYEVRDCIQGNYVLKFKFLAPRIPEISYIEVYTKE